MVHFTCDVCGKEMSLADKDRFVIRIEIRPANNSTELTEEDVDDDNLEKVSQLLNQMEETGELAFENSNPVKIRHDLCAACREKFLKNPFNCQPAPKFKFSEN